MGILYSYLLGDTGKTNDPDQVTGLTSRDKYIINTTWKSLSSGKANLETGMAIFLHFFKRYPHYQKLFPLRDIPLSELKNHDSFKAHCITVMSGLSAIIGSIDSPLVLEQLLLKQGVNHVPRKVPREAFEQLKNVILDLFSKSMNPEQLASWKKFLDLGFSVMVKGADSVTAGNKKF